MLEMKLDKFRAASGTGEVDIRLLKKAEIAKCNEYCKSGLIMFAHFTYMYAANSDRGTSLTIESMEEKPLHALVSCGCMEPDNSKLLFFLIIFCLLFYSCFVVTNHLFLPFFLSLLIVFLFTRCY